MPTALVVGASRGLGRALVEALSVSYSPVFGTVRSGDHDLSKSAKAISGVDVSVEGAGKRIVEGLNGTTLDLVIYVAGVFPAESFDELSWEGQLSAYKICAMAPVFCASALHKAKAFNKGARFLLITTEGGSISLRVPSEGGGNYAHHASKAAENMVARLLSFDLKDDGVTVVAIHPGFMRTEMTKSVGFDKFWDDGGAVHPEEAAQSIVNFLPQIKYEHSGQFWAPRGPGDIGTAEEVLGKNLSTPLQLPW